MTDLDSTRPLTARQRQITTRILSNLSARVRKETPRGSARDVCAYLKLVEDEMVGRA